MFNMWNDIVRIILCDQCNRQHKLSLHCISRDYRSSNFRFVIDVFIIN